MFDRPPYARGACLRLGAERLCDAPVSPPPGCDHSTQPVVVMALHGERI